MKYLFLELFTLATALQNADDNECQEHRSCYKATEVKYSDDTDHWPACKTDFECEEDQYCIGYMWTYNNQSDSAIGCWPKKICAAGGSFILFQERNFQFFCTDEQIEENKDETPPWDLEPTTETIADEFSYVC